MNAFRRTVAAGAVVAVAALAPTAIAGAAPTAKPATPAQKLLLTQSELPAGFEIVPVPRGKMDSMLGTVGDAYANGTITPAQCGGTINRASFAGAADIPIVAAVNRASKDVVAETLTAATEKLGAKPGCEKVHVELGKVGTEIDKMVLDVSTTPITLPGAPANTKAFLSHTSGTIVTDGKSEPISESQVVAGTQVRGYTVLVNGTKVGKGASPDRALVARVLSSAVAKVRDAR